MEENYKDILKNKYLTNQMKADYFYKELANLTKEIDDKQELIKDLKNNNNFIIRKINDNIFKLKNKNSYLELHIEPKQYILLKILIRKDIERLEKQLILCKKYFEEYFFKIDFKINVEGVGIID